MAVQIKPRCFSCGSDMVKHFGVICFVCRREAEYRESWAQHVAAAATEPQACMICGWTDACRCQPELRAEAAALAKQRAHPNVQLQDLLHLLHLWEERTDHVHPGFSWANCHIKIYSDCSGAVIVALNAEPDVFAAAEESEMVLKMKEFFGATGHIERPVPFYDKDELLMILSEPFNIYAKREEPV